MKITELRIGNYILIEGVPQRITGFIPDDNHTNLLEGTPSVVFEHFKYKRDYETEFTECNPIPLTEEWLLKFGFEKDGYNDHKSYYYTLNGFKLNVDDGYLFLDNPNQLAEAKSIKIKHVHQLQNLYFALTGKELEV